MLDNVRHATISLNRSARVIRTHIHVQVDGRPMRSLFDTGRDVTRPIAGTQDVQPARISSVKTASGEGMTIDGTCVTDVTIGHRRYRTNILVTPDMCWGRLAES